MKNVHTNNLRNCMFHFCECKYYRIPILNATFTFSVNRNIPPPKSVIPAAPPPPPVVNPPPCITSPTQKAPVSILKPTNRGALPSLPPLPPTPDEGPRSTVDTSALNAATLGLRPVAKSQEDKKKASRY